MNASVEHVVVGVAQKDWRRFEGGMAAVGFCMAEVSGGSPRRRYVAVRTSQKAKPPEELSAQETQVIALVAEGRTNEAIAIDLDVSVQTVKRVLCRVISKLGAQNRGNAIALAFAAGVLPLVGDV